MVAAPYAHAQRADEDVIAEALNAFGSTVGRQSIGLYSAGSARGFSPVQAGNLRIDGLYFDEGASWSGLSARVVRSSSVSVGITSLAYPFAAPTGIVDYELRVPGQTAVLSELIGDASYGQAYDEVDGELPLVPHVLSMGAGVGFTRNVNYDGANRSDQWTGGWIARWQPSASVQVTPFWDLSHDRYHGEKPNEFIGDDGVPRYFPISDVGQNWANFYSRSMNFGTIVRVSLPREWQVSAGLFRALQYFPPDDEAALADINGQNQGEYSITALPANSSGSSSGELRVSKTLATTSLRSTLYARLAMRDSSIESGSGDTVDFGIATINAIPQFPMPHFTRGPLSDVAVRQLTPGVAYTGDWRGRAQLTVSVQKIFYHRLATAPGAPAVSTDIAPLLYHAALAVSLSKKLLAYSSYTQGFEEIGTAPLNAINRNQPAPAQRSLQVDAGLEYQIHPRLQFIGAVFSIEKPYFSVDRFDIYRELGQARSRGAELSLTGNLTDRLHVVSGVALIRPEVNYLPGSVSGPTHQVAVGPFPGYMTTALEYQLLRVKGLVLGAAVNTYSSHYAVYPDVDVPAQSTLDAQIRYHTRLLGYESTLLLQGYNLTDAHVLYPNPTRQFGMGDARRYELSLEMDF